jgi:thioredoxin 1
MYGISLRACRVPEGRKPERQTISQQSRQGVGCFAIAPPWNQSEGKHTMSQAVAVTTGDFESQVLQSSVPVLIDFWAVWCGPCKMIAPHVDAVASEYEGRVKVLKVNVDEEPEIAGKYGIMSIPTLLFFKGGKVVDQVVGAVPKSTITSKLEGLLG